VKGQFNEVHPIVTGASLLFVLNFVLSAVF
jgi:hypothetical protein